MKPLNRQISTLLLAGALLIAHTGCKRLGAIAPGGTPGGAESDNSNSQDSASLDFDPQELVNRQWTSPCRPVSKAPVFSEIVGLELGAYGAGTYEVIIYSFTDANCGTVYKSEIEVGQYVLADVVETSSGPALQIDYAIQGYNVWAMSAASSNSFNVQTLCGYTDWSPIQGLRYCLGSAGFPVLNQPRYDLVRIHEGKAIQGDPATGNGSTPENRPTELLSSQGLN